MGERPPVVIVGAHRSGTTWIGDAFALHPKLTYWCEPRHIWTLGNERREHDLLTAEDATPQTSERIRKAFSAYLRKQGGEQLVEKTPSNCLRVSFIRAVYPDAPIIVITRDGRAVVEATRRKIHKPLPKHRILTRMREIPPHKWPRYGATLADSMLRRAQGKPLRYWGPKPEGWRETMSDPLEVMLAKQWAGTITPAVRDARRTTNYPTMLIRYEDIVANPREAFGDMLEFAGLADQSDPVIDFVTGSVDRDRLDGWRDRLEPEMLELIRPYMEGAMEECGYAWDAPVSVPTIEPARRVA